MPVLPDHWITEACGSARMIEPYAPGLVRKGKVSYGVTSYGYDFRLAREFKLPGLGHVGVADPKSMERQKFTDYSGKSCVIPAGSFVLGRSFEYFRIPRDVLAICQGKSTYARCGLILNVTPLEPEWEGYLTISLVNAGSRALRVHAEEGIGQLVFLRAEEACRVSYADKKGKYQSQKGIRLAKV
jgi:dCTP deaminase